MWVYFLKLKLIYFVCGGSGVWVCGWLCFPACIEARIGIVSFGAGVTGICGQPSLLLSGTQTSPL